MPSAELAAHWLNASGSALRGVVLPSTNRPALLISTSTRPLVAAPIAGTNAPVFEGGSGRFTIDATTNLLTSAASTVTAASLFTALPLTPANAAALDWSLPTASAARTGGTGAFSGALATKAGSFVVGTSFVGAADPSGAKWWQGWTSYARN